MLFLHALLLLLVQHVYFVTSDSMLNMLVIMRIMNIALLI